MQNLTDQIKRALNALSYADIGERIGRQAKHAALDPPRTESEPTTTPASSRKWIALGVGATLAEPVMSYAIGACRRMQADLLLLSVDAMRVRELLADHLPALHGIECRTEELASLSTTTVLRALNLHRGVLFAISGAEDDPLRPLLRVKRGPRAPVAVVLVSPKNLGANTPLRMRVAKP